MKPSAKQVCDAAVDILNKGYRYQEMDCQAFVEAAVKQAGGSMDYRGSNDMARNMAWLGTIDEAKAEGKLVPGCLLFIHEKTDANLPDRYRGDGMGDFSHVGIYHGPEYPIEVSNSSKSRGGTADSTLRGGWTHVGLAHEIDYKKEGGDVVMNVQTARIQTADGNPLKLRSTPGTEKPYIAKMPDGDSVEVLADAQGWAKVIWNSITGYAMSQYLVMDDPGTEPEAPESGQEATESDRQMELLERIAEGVDDILDELRGGGGNG